MRYGDGSTCEREGHLTNCVMQVNRGRSKPRLYFWRCENCDFLLVGDRRGNEIRDPEAEEWREKYLKLEKATTTYELRL